MDKVRVVIRRVKNKYDIRTNFLKYMGEICVQNALKKLMVDLDENKTLYQCSKYKIQVTRGRVINLQKGQK